MKPFMKTRSDFSSHSQRGATLAVVLILLLVVTLLALMSMRGALMEERMSGSVRDRGLSFQAVEAGLREGEAHAAQTGLAIPASGCTNGVCGIPDPAAAPVWEDEAVWATAPEVVVNLEEKTAKSKFIVELLAENVPPLGSCTTTEDVSSTGCSGTEKRFRVTARSQAEGRAEVMLQSIYAVP